MEMSKDERSCLLYVESCCVDKGGLLEGERMNAADHEALSKFRELGLVESGRIPFRLIAERPPHLRSKPTHWARLSPEGWRLAHSFRTLRAEQLGPYSTAIFADVGALADEHVPA